MKYRRLEGIRPNGIVSDNKEIGIADLTIIALSLRFDLALFVGKQGWLVHNVYCPTVYRGMKNGPDGLPLPGESARTLGARPNLDIPINDGMVYPNTGGMPVSPNDILNLPTHRRPPQYGGTGSNGVFCLETACLPKGLQYRPDPANPSGHGFIEPSWPMSFSKYQQLLQGTAPLWTTP